MEAISVNKMNNLKCAVHKCPFAKSEGTLVEIEGLTFFMCLVHANGKERAKNTDCICSDDGKIMCKEHYKERYTIE